MEKLKICLDSCTFFYMLDYNDLICSGKIKEFKEQKKLDSENNKNNKIDLENFLDLVVPLYSNKYNLNWSMLEKTEAGKSIKDKLNDEERNMYISLTRRYGNSKVYEGIPELLEKMKNGEVEFCLVEEAQQEILNHASDTIESNHSHFDLGEIQDTYLFKKESINRLMKECNIIRYKDAAEEQKIYNLSKILRGLSEPLFYNTKQNGKKILLKPMPSKTNSRGNYGDPIIMAHAASNKMMLVTQNERDYIYDFGRLKDKTGVVPARRNLIEEILKKLDMDITSLPYNASEMCKIIDEYNGKNKITNQNIEREM